MLGESLSYYIRPVSPTCTSFHNNVGASVKAALIASPRGDSRRLLLGLGWCIPRGCTSDASPHDECRRLRVWKCFGASLVAARWKLRPVANADASIVGSVGASLKTALITLCPMANADTSVLGNVGASLVAACWMLCPVASANASS